MLLLQDIRVSNFSSTVAEPSTYILGTHAYVLRNNVAARLHALSETPPYKDEYLPVDIFLTQQVGNVPVNTCPAPCATWPSMRLLCNITGIDN